MSRPFWGDANFTRKLDALAGVSEQIWNGAHQWAGVDEHGELQFDTEIKLDKAVLDTTSDEELTRAILSDKRLEGFVNAAINKL